MRAMSDNTRSHSQPHVLRIAISQAIAAAMKSPCRSQRGAAVWRGNTIISVGFNYVPAGDACDGSTTCKQSCGLRAIHAEQMALVRGDAHGAEMLHVHISRGHLMASGPPSCLQCSKLMLAAELSGMWLFHTAGWRRYDVEEFHRLTLAHHGFGVVPEVANA